MGACTMAFIGVLIVQVAGDSEMSTRALDVSDLVAQPGVASFAFDLCPAHPSGKLEDDAPAPEETEIGLDVDDLRSTLQELADHRWPQEVVRFTASGARLFVTAPAALRDDIATLVGLLRSACVAEERVQVRVLTGQAVLDLPLLLDAGEADRRVAEMLAAGKAAVARAGSTALRDGVVSDLQALDTRLYTRDYDLEIAGSTGIYDPVIDAMALGLEAKLRTVRVIGGTYLDLAVRHIEADRWRERVLEPMVRCVSQKLPAAGAARPASAATIDGTMQERMPIRIDFPLNRTTAWAGSFVVPDGSVLFVPCRVATHTSDVVCAFEVRVTGTHRPERTELPGGGKDGLELVILQVGGLRTPGFDAARMDATAFVNGPRTERDAGDFWPSRVHAAPLATTHGALAIAKPDIEDEAAIYQHDLTPFQFVLQAPAETCARVSARVAARLEGVPEFEVSGRVVSGERELAQFCVPALSGTLATLWSGLSGSFLLDWDVDVANEAAIANPRIGWLLDGVALQFVVRPLSARRLQLSVNGKLHFLAEPPALKQLTNPFVPAYEKVKARSLWLDETVHLDNDGAKRTARFGDASLSLEISVVQRSPAQGGK